MDSLHASGITRSGLMQSTTGQAQIILVNGPLRNTLGFNSTNNIFGPGDRANATVGRALRLIVMNVLGIRPHEFDQSTQGTSAKYACCIAENEEESPWEPLHVDRGFAPDVSTVTAQMIRSDLYVEHRSTQEPEEILMTIADSMSYGGAVTQVTEVRNDLGAVVVMGPEHAQLIAARGWSKQDCQEFLFQNFGKRKSELRRMGKLHPSFDAETEDAFIPHGVFDRQHHPGGRRCRERRRLDGVPVDHHRPRDRQERHTSDPRSLIAAQSSRKKILPQLEPTTTSKW